MNMVENFYWKSAFSAPASPDVKLHGAYGWAICNGGELNFPYCHLRMYNIFSLFYLYY